MERAMTTSMSVALVARLLVLLLLSGDGVMGLPSHSVQRHVRRVNAQGSHLGIVVPNAYEMSPLLNDSIFKPYSAIPTIDLAGRRFYIGTIESHRVIVVMSGLSMLNAGITTELLVTFFKISGVVHYGIAGNANEALNIGDVTIPKYWAHTGLWSWQRYGLGPNDSLPLEEDGDYTRSIGYLHFGDYNNPPQNRDNYLNNIWFQPEEVFPVTGTPEVREHYFWVPVNNKYLKIAKEVEGIELVSCTNATNCLAKPPKVVIVERGISANVYLDNAAYRGFLHAKFDVTPVDMESASVALVCLTNNVPFIAIRALSDLAGGSSNANEIATFFDLAATNAVIVLTNFIKRI